jgi:ATP-dependent Lon protease
VEFLLGRYCASTDPAEIEEGLQIVEKQLQGRTVRTGEEELFKARARDQGSVKIIDIVRARLDTRSDSYAAEVPSLAIKDAQIDDELVRANERMLTDGFYAEVTLEYDPVIAQERNGRPFSIAGLRPIQMSNPNVLGILAKGRAAFTTDEWRDFLIRSIGLEPTASMSGPRWWCYSAWLPLWSATSTWLSWGHAARARATCSSRSPPTRT